MSVGQPTKFKDEYCEEIIQLARKGLEMYSIAAKWNVCYETLQEWTRVNSTFSAAYKRARTIQTADLFQDLLKNRANRDYNHKLAALLLAHVAKLSEARTATIVGLGEGTLAEQGKKVLKSGSNGESTSDEILKLIDAISKLAKVEEITELRQKIEEFEKLQQK